ncbi:MAG: glycosyltransferase family 2 protein [Lachnospiraceae bacterium]|nr:glycosyltransferase family 2 protein [Lachnospiraceae bacterium]
MRLSVIVPVYNMAAEGKLTFCLDSLLNQTIPPDDVEIIAVDDASTDASFEILQSYEAKHPGHFFALRHPENLHQGGAKNSGLKQARGEWISFIDADDWVAPEYYEKLLTLAEKEHADAAGCDYSMVTSHSFEIGKVDKNSTREQAGERTKESLKARVLAPGSLAVKIFRRELLLQAAAACPGGKLFPEKIFYEDNAVGAYLMARVGRYAYLEEPLYYYYQHDSSTVHTVSLKRLEDRAVAGRMLLALAKADGTLSSCRDEIEYSFTRLFYINTLFSAMQARPHVKGGYRFCKALGEEMRCCFPLFRSNPYYEKEVHPEEKKLINMQMKSHPRFYAYYRMLWWYRDHFR